MHEPWEFRGNTMGLGEGVWGWVPGPMGYTLDVWGTGYGVMARAWWVCIGIG